MGTGVRESLELILARYAHARVHDPFGKQHELWNVFEGLRQAFLGHRSVTKRPTLQVSWSIGQGVWAKVPWIAFLDKRETETTQEGVYCVYLFRQDMSGLYLTFNQGVTRLQNERGKVEARRILRDRATELRPVCADLAARAFVLDDKIDLRADRGLGADYEDSTIAYKLYGANVVPGDDALEDDLEPVLTAYDRYLETRKQGKGLEPTIGKSEPELPYEPQAAVNALVDYIAGQRFVFEPWQVAAYVVALRTKPFVILAGVTGTGKSKLPALVARGTGSKSHLLPVRPDWTDSADVLGYSDLQGNFRPGMVLELAQRAVRDPWQHWVCIVDEMNLARVEHYFAEILSRIEDRHIPPGGGFASGPLLSQTLRNVDAEWLSVVLPANLALVGTVNMDETAHGFSRKVLDRAFTLELSDVDLTMWKPNESEAGAAPAEARRWPVNAWYPRSITLGGLRELSEEEGDQVSRVIKTLTEVNRLLTQAQLQVGYRTRDEVALFVLHASQIASSFVTRSGHRVDPLDLALHMKVPSRIVGGSGAIKRVLLQMLGWARGGKPLVDEDEAGPILDEWRGAGRPGTLEGAHYPRTAARLCLMWERFQAEGFTSFWL